MASMFIFSTRLLGVILYIGRSYSAVFHMLVMVLSQAGGVLTVRNDVVKDIHLFSAAVWIGFTLYYHFQVSTNNAIYKKSTDGAAGARITFGLSLACGVAFLLMVFFSDWNSNKSTRLYTGILEFGCVELILCNDLILAVGIYYNFLKDYHRHGTTGSSSSSSTVTVLPAVLPPLKEEHAIGIAV